MSKPRPDGAEITGQNDGGVSRRAVVQAVAWSVPVIAMAGAAPMAAASGGDDAEYAVTVGSLEADNGTAEGTFTPSLYVTSADTFTTGTITATFHLTEGPWSTASITKPKPGREAWEPGTAVTATDGGIWSVLAVSEDSVSFQISNVEVSGGSVLALPTAAYSGTYDNSQLTNGNPLTVSVDVTVTGNGAGTASNAIVHKLRTEYTKVAFDAPSWGKDRSSAHATAITATEAAFTIGPPTNSGTKYYRFEGVRALTVGHITEEQALPAGVNNVRATLQINPAWATINYVTAELWARAPYSDPATEGTSAFPTIFFTSSDDDPRIEVFDLYANIHQGPKVTGASVILEIAHDPFTNTYTYYADGVAVHTESAWDARYLDTVFLNHQNPNHPLTWTSPATPPSPPVEFAVTWTDLEFGERIDLGSYIGCAPD